MKKVNAPKPKYDFYNGSMIKKTLESYQKSQSKKGMMNISLYGAYKLIRPMPIHAGLGDFVILSECIKWLREMEQKPTETEIRRCMMYFNPEESQSFRKQLAKTFFQSVAIVPGLN